MTNYRCATVCPEFELAWAGIENDFKAFLREKRLDVVMTWAHLVPTKVCERGFAENHLVSLLRELGAGERTDAWTPDAKALWKAAKGEAAELALRVGGLQGIHLTADAAERKEAKDHATESQDLRRLHAAALANLPLEWRGKRYRRKERLGNEAERADAEAAERKRWGREAAGLLAEAQLPFSKSLGDAEPDSAVALRCCRGLRA